MTGRRALALSAVFTLVLTLVVFRLQTASNAAAPSSTQLISKTSDTLPPPNQGPNPSDSPSESADGQFTAFVSQNNLDPRTAANPGGNPDIQTPHNQIYVRNRATGVTTWVSDPFVGGSPVCFDGARSTTQLCDAFQPSISQDGQFVAFTSRFNGGTPSEQCGPNAPGCEVYVADLHSPARPITATLVSTSDRGKTQAAGVNDQPAISGDGSSVAFVSTATLDNLADPTGQGLPEVFVHVMATGANKLVSSDLNGNRPNLQSACVSCPFVGASQPTISSNGRFVAFTSDEPLVHEWFRNSFPLNLVYVRDRDATASGTFDQGGVGLMTTRLVSKDAFGQLPQCGVLGDSGACQATNPSISSFDGSKVAFVSQAFNLGGPTTNQFVSQVFVHDRNADANVNLVFVSFPNSGTMAFAFDRPVALNKGTPGSDFQLVLSNGTVVKGTGSPVIDTNDPTVVDVTPPIFTTPPNVDIARGVVLPQAVSAVPASIAPDNSLETTIFNGSATQGATTGPNLLSVSSTATGVRFTFDDVGTQPNTVANPKIPLRVFDARGVETPAGPEVIHPSTPAANEVSIDAPFSPGVLAGAVGASAPAGAVSNNGVPNNDDEMLAPVRPINAVASVDSSGKEGVRSSSEPSISSDGRIVGFASFANFDGKSTANTGCVPEGQPNTGDVFARDLVIGTTNRVSMSSGDVAGDCTSDQPSVSQNGRYIAFHSFAHNLAPDTNDNPPRGPNVDDVFLRDRAPVLWITPPAKDFGSVEIGSPSAPVVFTVTNKGEGAALIGTRTLTGANPTNFQIVSDTCGTLPSQFLYPGDPGCTITVVFTPFSPPPPGPRAADLNVNSDAPASPLTDQLRGTASIPPPPAAVLMLTPSPEKFVASVLVGSSATANLTLTNTGGSPAAVTSLPISGTNGGEFSVTSTTCIGTLNPSTSCPITVKFAPSAVGTRTANLSVTSNANPVNDPLSGTGIQPAITLSPVPDKFGSVPLTTSATSTVTATDTGTAPASISGIGISGTTTDFALLADGCSGKTLAPGASCQIVLRFAPSAPGDRIGLLTVIDNGPGSPHTDPLIGRGVRLEILPNVGAPSDVATVTGDGWQPSHQVLVNWDPGLGSQLVTTDATGHFSVLMLLFRHDNIGPRKVAANDGTTIIKQPFLAVPGSSGPPGWILRR